MNTIGSLINKGLTDPSQILGGVARIFVRNQIVSDETAIKVTFKSLLGYPLDLDNPHVSAGLF